MDYKISNGRVWLDQEGNGQFGDYCEAFGITNVATDLLTGEQTVELTIETAAGDVSFTLPRCDMNRKIIPKLLNYGLSVMDTNTDADLILQILIESEATATRVFRHDRLGFCKIDGNDIFLAHQPIGLLDPGKACSEYAIPSKTKPVGSFESWRAMIENEVLGHPNLELALALGAVAPLAHLLNEELVVSSVPVFALIGCSSTGKTTALRLMASIYGAPTISGGMISDLNATQTAFFAQLNRQFGVPTLIDETSSAPEWDFTKLLYNLPTGREKLRCDSQGQLKVPLSYSGCVIFTGERSIFDQSNSNNGLFARLIEFTLPWTDDADHAFRIEQSCRTNYGTAVAPLLTWLMQNRECLSVSYRQHYDQLKAAVPTADGVEDRMLKTYALITLGAEVVTRALALPLNITAIQATLLTNYENTPYVLKPKNTIKVIYEHIKQQVLDNYISSPTKGETRFTRQFWGAIGTKDGFPCVWITEAHFKDFLHSAKNHASTNAESNNAIMRALHKENYLVRHYGDRFCKDEKFGDITMKCYCLRLVGTAVPPPKKKSTNKHKSQISRLLSDEEAD